MAAKCWCQQKLGLRYVFVELHDLNRRSNVLYNLSPGFISRPEDVLSCLRVWVSNPLTSQFQCSGHRPTSCITYILQKYTITQPVGYTTYCNFHCQPLGRVQNLLWPFAKKKEQTPLSQAIRDLPKSLQINARILYQILPLTLAQPYPLIILTTSLHLTRCNLSYWKGHCTKHVKRSVLLKVLLHVHCKTVMKVMKELFIYETLKLIPTDRA